MKKTKINKEDLEKIPLLIIYKQGENIYAEEPETIINRFELYGFLKIVIKFQEEMLFDEMIENTEKKT